MKAIIDGDVFAYMAAAYADSGHQGHEIDFGDGVKTGDGTEVDPIEVLRGKVETIKKQPKITSVIVALSDQTGRNFRKDIHPGYKASRVSEKPTRYAECIAWFYKNFTTYEFPGLEGDDVMGLLLTGEKGYDYVGYSTDKDIYTLPATLQRISRTGEIGPRQRQSIREADLFWMTQTIAGDAVDEYKGAPGAGPVAAEKALAGLIALPSMWDAVLHVYADQFDHKKWGKQFTCKSAYDEALMNARCARILRHGDYNHDTGEVKLWTPSNQDTLVWSPKKTTETSTTADTPCGPTTDPRTPRPDTSKNSKRRTTR